MRGSLVLLFVVGCGGVDLTDFQDESLDARCEYLTRCGLFPSETACQSYFAGRTAQSTSIVAAVDAGKVKYDEDLAEECIDALRDASCSQGASLDSSCDDIFVGTVADGGACAFDDECVSGTCSITDCTDACCPGMCVPSRPVPKIGEMCNFVCEDGAYCADDNTCHAELPVGAACADPFACVPGAYCADRTTTTSGTCKKLPATGEACVDICGNIGDYCDGTCKPVGQLGAVCSKDDACSFYYECDETMHCAETPVPTLMPNGATCSSSVQCQSHYCGNDNTCADVPECI
jgi:hypothetical protein